MGTVDPAVTTMSIPAVSAAAASSGFIVKTWVSWRFPFSARMPWIVSLGMSHPRWR